MAFAPSASWNSRSITHLANYPSPSLPMIFSDESYFHDDKSGKSKQIILSVKSGHVTHSQVRDLRGVLDREKAEIGVFITLEEPTKPMLKEAASAGFYKSSHIEREFPRLQIITIDELLKGESIQYPQMLDVTFKRAPRANSRQARKQDE